MMSRLRAAIWPLYIALAIPTFGHGFSDMFTEARRIDRAPIKDALVGSVVAGTYSALLWPLYWSVKSWRWGEIVYHQREAYERSFDKRYKGE